MKRISQRLLSHFENHNSKWFQRIQLQILMDLAAQSFGAPRKRIWTKPADEALAAYAAYTVQCMASPVNTAFVFLSAKALGEKVRRRSGLTDPEDLQRLVFLLYRNINITMEGQLPGEITVRHCYFSDHYTPEQCQIMSCVDSGIVSGICGGDELIFSQRITEGCAVCRACLCEKEHHNE